MTHLELGRILARRVFAKRGNHSEIHITEVELAAMLALTAQRAVEPFKLFAELAAQGIRSELGLQEAAKALLQEEPNPNDQSSHDDWLASGRRGR